MKVSKLLEELQTILKQEGDMTIGRWETETGFVDLRPIVVVALGVKVVVDPSDKNWVSDEELIWSPDLKTYKPADKICIMHQCD